MPYVMVPVPEEYVQDVMRYVLKRIQEEELEDWDEESMRRFFGESDEITRAILSYVAQPDHDGRVRQEDVARSLELPGYVPRMIRDLKLRSRQEYGRISPIRQEKEYGSRPGGRPVPLLVMDDDVAALVRKAEQAVHRSELGEDDG